MCDVDVLVIGAGISGIGAGYHLEKDTPHLSYKIIEARDDLGGTWDLFKYPGIRSDSDLFTFAYEFKPWKGDQAIADGSSIKSYLKETAQEFNIYENIVFQNRVIDLDWDSEKQLWNITLRHEKNGEESSMTSRWIFNASGYYRYDRGFTPDFPGLEKFEGKIIHPQSWPEDLDYQDKEVIVIGSGATAVTLIPAMAKKTKHITMLQRTPTYILPVPSKDALAIKVRKFFGDRAAYYVARRFHILKQKVVYKFCQNYPKLARRLIRNINLKMLPEDYPVDEHFNPPYDPWDQRLCAVPGGDLFRVISSKEASIVTDEVDTFTKDGILLKTGRELNADIIITATGLNLLPLGGIQPKIDGNKISIQDKVTYKGILLSDVPNFAFAIGYTSSSWTLKIGLLCEYFTRLLTFMGENDYVECRAKADPNMKTQPFLNFGAGYVKRSLDKLPKQGDRFPWSTSFNYSDDVRIFRKGKIDDPELKFSKNKKAIS